MGNAIPVFGSRPPVIERNGVVVYVSIHDAKFLSKKEELRKALRAHPDTGGSTAAFLKAHRAYKRWLAKEIAWYAHFGLEPPKSGSNGDVPAPPPQPREIRIRKSLHKGAAERVLAGLCAGCGQSRGDNGTQYKCRNCADADADKQRQRNAVGNAVGRCRNCPNQKGEDGTNRLCRPCADQHAAKQRNRNKVNGESRFTRRRNGLPPGKRKTLAVYLLAEEAQIWFAIAEKERTSLTHLIRMAVRSKYNYPTGHLGG